MTGKIKLVLVAILILSMALCFAGCGKTSYEEIGQKVFLDEDCVSGLMYSDGATMLTSFGKATKSGKSMKTRGFATYDLKSGDITNVASIVSSYKVTSAVPEEDGIVYVAYTKDENKVIKWNVIELKSGTDNYVLSGECKSTSELPVLHRFNDGVAVVWKDRASDIAGLSMISGGNADRLVTDSASHIVNTISSANEKYATIYTKDDDKNRHISISDTDGVLKRVPIDGKLREVAITQNNVIAVIRQGNEPARYKLFNYNISEDTAEYTELNAALYDLSGGDGDAVICHDLDGRVYMIDAKKNTVKAIDQPENTDGAAIAFGKIVKNKVISAFTKDGVCKFYMIDIK